METYPSGVHPSCAGGPATSAKDARRGAPLSPSGDCFVARVDQVSDRRTQAMIRHRLVRRQEAAFLRLAQATGGSVDNLLVRNSEDDDARRAARRTARR
jgi:hypothetical protein